MTNEKHRRRRFTYILQKGYKKKVLAKNEVLQKKYDLMQLLLYRDMIYDDSNGNAQE